MKHKSIPPFLACLLMGFLPSHSYGKYSLNRVHSGINTPKPINLVVVPDGSGQELLVLQGGKILALPNDRSSGKAEVFLDISVALRSTFVQGGWVNVEVCVKTLVLTPLPCYC